MLATRRIWPGCCILAKSPRSRFPPPTRKRLVIWCGHARTAAAICWQRGTGYRNCLGAPPGGSRVRGEVTLLTKRMRFHITLQRQQTTALPATSGNTTPLTMSRPTTDSPVTCRTIATNWALSISETGHFHLAPSARPEPPSGGRRSPAAACPAPAHDVIRQRIAANLSDR